MQVKRNKEKFSIENLDLMDFLVLYIAVVEGRLRIVQALADFKFANPDEVKKRIGKLQQELEKMLPSRTPEEMKFEFFKKPL